MQNFVDSGILVIKNKIRDTTLNMSAAIKSIFRS